MVHFKLETLLKQISMEVLVSIAKEINSLAIPEIAIPVPEIEDQHEQQVVQALLALYADEEKLEKLYIQLSALERNVLNYFLFFVHGDFLTYRQIEEIAEMEPVLFRRGLIGLSRKGVIYTIRRQWGEVAYILPTDLAALFYNLYLRGAEVEEVKSCTDRVTSNQVLPHPFFTIIFLILDELRAETNMSVPLTQRGSIHKRFIRNWQEKWMEYIDSLEGLKLPFANRDTYSSYMALLLDFLTRKKIIRWYKEKLQLDEYQADRWMSLSREQMVAEFLWYWNTYIKPSTPWLVRYQQDMLRQRTGEWMYLLSFVEIWEKSYSLPSIPELQQQLIEEILDPWVCCGLIERGRTEQGEEVWRWRRAEEHQSTLWMDATLGLYCSSLLPFSLLWKLSLILQIEAWEYTLLFSLSEKKVHAALEREADLDLWLEWLRELVPIPLPADFVEQIYHWRKSREQISIQTQTVIEIKDLTLAEAWLEWPEVSELPIRKIQPTLFLTSKQYEQTIIELLSRRGFSLQEKVEAFTLAEREQEFTMIEFALDKQHVKVESIFPELTDALPAWHSFPELWKKQLVAYHEQSARRIIEEALKHYLHLRIETRDAKVLEIIPKSCAVVDGQWVCYDQHNTLYPLNEIAKLQLLFPVQ